MTELKHTLIPEHTKLSKKEAQQLLDRYDITIKELPKILLSDPAIEHLDLDVGDIVKIERESRTAGKTTYYRGVTNG